MSMYRRKWIWLAVVMVLCLAAITAWNMPASSQAKSQGEIVYVYSDSCGFCSSFNPKFEKVVKDFPDWHVEKLDIFQKEQYEKAVELGAVATPTVFLMRDSQVLDSLEGDVSENTLRSFIEKNMIGPSS